MDPLVALGVFSERLAIGINRDSFQATCAFIRSHHDDGLSPTMRALACFLQLGTPGQAAHSSNRRMISMSLHPNRMREPHNMKGTP